MKALKLLTSAFEQYANLPDELVQDEELLDNEAFIDLEKLIIEKADDYDEHWDYTKD